VRVVGWLLAALAAAGPLAAQGDCFPTKDSNEARSFAILSVPLAFTAAAAPAVLRPGAVTVGLEVSSIPTVGDALATPTQCRPGKGPEHVNILPGYVRPRLAVGLPWGLAAEVSWVPPVTVKGARPDLVGLALSATARLGATALSLRADASMGVIHAPITCDREALEDPNSECHLGTLSNDSYRPNVFGLTALAGRTLGGGRVALYGAIGYAHLAPRFRVNFTNQFGDTDRRRVEVDLDRLTLSLGGTLSELGPFSLSGELHSTPADAVAGRLVIRAPLRR
jgi:hypothetical protein